MRSSGQNIFLIQHSLFTFHKNSYYAAVMLKMSTSELQ